MPATGFGSNINCTLHINQTKMFSIELKISATPGVTSNEGLFPPRQSDASKKCGLNLRNPWTTKKTWQTEGLFSGIASPDKKWWHTHTLFHWHGLGKTCWLPKPYIYHAANGIGSNFDRVRSWCGKYLRCNNSWVSGPSWGMPFGRQFLLKALRLVKRTSPCYTHPPAKIQKPVGPLLKYARVE